MEPGGQGQREAGLPQGRGPGTLSAGLLLPARALPTTPGRISPLTVVQSVSGLPPAFTVHVAGGLSLEIHAPGAGIPH